MNEWLAENHGITGFTFKQNPEDNQNHVDRSLWGDTLALVERPRGLHAIVCRGSKVVWDPCPKPVANEDDPDDWLYMLFMLKTPRRK